MAAQPRAKLTPEQYLELDRASAVRSEFFAGEMVAMSGGTRTHARLIVNLAAALNEEARRKGCEILTDLRLQCPGGLYTYPDLMAVCSGGASDFEDTIENPSLVLEVPSRSTEARERGPKLAQYLSIPSLQEYVLVSQFEPLVEVHRRGAGAEWIYSAARGAGSRCRLESLDCHLELGSVYRDVRFDAPHAG